MPCDQWKCVQSSHEQNIYLLKEKSTVELSCVDHAQATSVLNKQMCQIIITIKIKTNKHETTYRQRA